MGEGILPPHEPAGASTFPDWDLEREKDVIRCAMEREKVAPIDDPQHFGRHAHAIIWTTIKALVKAGNVRRVLYRLPQLRVETAFIAEGEKDADALCRRTFRNTRAGYGNGN